MSGEVEKRGGIDGGLLGHRAAIAAAVIDLGDYPVATDTSAAGRAAIPARRGRIDAAHAVQQVASPQLAVQRFAGRRIAGQPLVLRMAARISECQWVDKIYAVGCHLPPEVANIQSPLIETVSLPHCHLVERLGAIQDRSQTEWLVYVPANRPFVDAGLIDGLLSKAKNTKGVDYLAYASNASERPRLDHLGLDGEVCHADSVRRLCRDADRLPACNSLLDCIENAPGTYHREFVPLPTALDHCSLRFAIENEADWDDAQLVCESLDEVDAAWQQAAGLVMRNEDLRSNLAVRA